MPEIISRAEAKKKGLKYYYTGKPCKQYHFAKREVRKSECVICKKLYFQKRNLTDKENLRRYRQKYQSSKKYKIVRSRYSKSDKGKEARKRYQQSEKGIWYRKNITEKSINKKNSDKKYYTSEKGKATRRTRERKPENILKKINYRKNTKTGQKLLMWSNIRSRLKKWTTKLGSRGN
ncbi:MAG: hypothetical protein VXA18_03820, partial [Gammaproteobacteria bacterium]